MTNRFVQAVLNNKDRYVIFYSEWCRYSNDALDLLRSNDIKYKRYIIDDIKNIGGVPELGAKFMEDTSLEFDPKHTTRPIVFKFGKFLGGFTELKNDIDNYLKKL